MTKIVIEKKSIRTIRKGFKLVIKNGRFILVKEKK